MMVTFEIRRIPANLPASFQVERTRPRKPLMQTACEKFEFKFAPLVYTKFMPPNSKKKKILITSGLVGLAVYMFSVLVLYINLM